MSMESSRRPFDRLREQPGPKKPRLIEDSNPNSRPFPQRQLNTGTATVSSARYRVSDRDSESVDFGRGGGGYEPQPLQPPQQHRELVTQYRTALAELTFNSKPIITNLTIIAGENQSAAKAIAATVCANIIEVPSEQKLPSLYLLDSIVKNIGRDYIKYFAAKLPEVFIKAYRQVDPPIHQSMRHLFGTWKGVFPLPTLQIIEKELGFTPVVNGSTSSSGTPRSDSQSQRPPHSIHVNPKYLERQRLQQSSRIKGVEDITAALGNSNEDPERSDRALGVTQPWADASVSTHRDAFDDSVLEKSIGASYGSNEYGSDLSRNLGSGMGRAGSRVTELGHDKSWYKAGGVAGTISGQRNGFSGKNSFPKTEAPKYHEPKQNINCIRSSAMSSSWKNSEEEEYTWDEMNSRSTGHGLSKDPWTADDENLEVADHIKIRNPFGANADREMAAESLGTKKKQFPPFRRHPSLSWQSQEQHSLDELNQKPGHSEGFMSTLGGLPANRSSSAARLGNRSFLPNATAGLAGIAGQQQFHSVGAESPPEQSPLRQQSSSPAVSVYRPQMRNLAEQEHSQSLKTSQFLEGLQSHYIKDSSPSIPPNVPVSINSRRSQQNDLQGPFSSTTSFQPRHQQQLGLPRTEVTVKTEKPRLDKGNLPSILGVRPSQSGGPSTATLISSVSAIAAPSSLGPPIDNSSAQPKIPERKAGRQQPRASTLPPAASSAQTSSATVNPIANLLSSLVAKGLISAESESGTKVPSEILTRLEDQREGITTSSSSPVTSVSGSAAVPVPSTVDDVDDTAKTPISVAGSTKTEIRNLIGFEFKPDVIRELHPPVVKGLFDDLPHRCSICGLRLQFQEQYNKHLEWHATRERENNDLITVSRRWYIKSSDWIVGTAEHPSECDDESTESVDTYGKQSGRSQEDDATVQADENQCLCVLCGEVFEDFYCQESGEWMFKGAVYMTRLDSDSEMGDKNMSTAKEGPIIHARCLSENSISSVLKMDQD